MNIRVGAWIVVGEECDHLSFDLNPAIALQLSEGEGDDFSGDPGQAGKVLVGEFEADFDPQGVDLAILLRQLSDE